MLDTDTKRRIDSCRDILVGKVPDPKSQVEQITIALIYKFMDDMDAEAEELGGKRSFFAGDYANYGWAKLMRAGLGGHETLNLYAEAIAKMPENPGIPALFRDIFKNAYLPYRDPETLRSFLKEIDGFTYDHSERLGDAFEYLLSVLGSQGEAGQFRTPRHIIDFMVEIIDPKKNESILDPACGTAGFLISAWKHILKNNSELQITNDEQNPALIRHSQFVTNTLTPTERANLAANIHGYDISPDMVRLSLVNLYLHGFTDPHIVEYDTLTSEEKWFETADVILANPPFMSPKGGIKPHKRFSIQATRSEVLFVDYMAEHLSPQGRAAIIVPEGIIFQSGNAYKQLREMLVKTSLVAVVSLPAGVFNPYSGVKTSILILDKRLAKNTDDVLFVKIENDGYNLGAQRRAVTGSGLPDAVRHLRKFFTNAGAFESSAMAHKVARAKIGENGEWNLSAEQYRVGPAIITSYEIALIGDVVSTITPPAKLQKESYFAEGHYPIIDQSQQEIAGWTDDELAVICPTKPLVIFGDHTCAVKLVNQPFVQGADGIKILETDDSLLPAFLFHFLKANPLEPDGYKRHFTDLKRKKIPVPPLHIQQEIIAEIDGYQKVIDGARAVLDHYRPRIPIHPEWPIVGLGEVLRKSEKSVLPESLSGSVTYVGLENISQGTGEICGNIVSDNPADIKSLKNVFKAGDILYGKLRPNLNKVWLADRAGICSTDIFVIEPVGNHVITGFYASVLRSEPFNDAVMSHIKGAQLPRVGWSSFASIKVPLPPLATQQAIVAEIEAEQALVNANKELITRFEAKIKTTINRVWGESTAITN